MTEQKIIRIDGGSAEYWRDRKQAFGLIRDAELAATDTPFGRVVAPLGFRRERLASRRGPSNFCTDPATVLSQVALLRLPDGRPISLVAECYTAANLGRRR